MRYFICFVVLNILTGCSDISHRYGPNPFGEESQYDVAYIHASVSTIYLCLVHGTKNEGYSMEDGWPDENDISSFFVTNRNAEVARYDFDPRYSDSTGVEVGVYTTNKTESKTFNRILNVCSDELRPGKIGADIFDAIIHAL